MIITQRNGRRLLIDSRYHLQREIARVHDKMTNELEVAFANWLEQVNELKAELAEARRELDFLRGLAAEARVPLGETLH
jgi:hypothetical protein